MGKGTVAKKRGGGKGKADDADKKILKEQLDSTGPFILRDFCRQHGMDPDDAKTFPKTKLISFLMGKFKDGELTLNDLYPDKEGGKKSGGKSGSKKSPSKSKAKEEPEDDELDGGDEDGAGDDDMDDDELDFELDGDEDGDGDDDDEGGGDDDIDLEDEVNDELDDDDDGDGDDSPDISIIEDKLDKIIDQNSKISKTLDLLVQISLEGVETLRQGLKVLFKIGKIKNPGKLLKQIESKARKFAGIENGDDDELEDE